MNFIQNLLGMRRAKPQNTREYEQAKAQLAHAQATIDAHAQATIDALAYPTEPIKKPKRKAHDHGPH